MPLVKNQSIQTTKPLVRVGPKHQITIPKEAFERLALSVGDLLEVQVRAGIGILKPKHVVDRFTGVSVRRREKVEKSMQPAHEDERDSWYGLAASSLERAYGEDEPEYTPEMITESNPAYERR